MQRKHLAWLGSGFSAVHAEQIHGGGGAGALLVRSLAFCSAVNNLCRGPVLIPISLRSSSSRSRNIVSSMASSRSRLSRSLRPMLARSVVIASSPRLELDTQEVMLSPRDRPDDELEPADRLHGSGTVVFRSSWWPGRPIGPAEWCGGRPVGSGAPTSVCSSW